jgi:Saccharopine dehydrogenase NADP binding domain
MTAIGVIGGYGSVGRATVAQLRAWGLGPIVVAGRDPTKADVVVDINEPSTLERLYASLRLVINCTASSPTTRAAVADAAAANGVPYVDPGGDEPVYELLSGRAHPEPVVLSAGMLPGLTGLLPRLLVAERGSRLVCYVGGQDRFSLGGAADYLAAVNGSAGRNFAVWRNGSRVERAGVAAIEGTVPHFSEPASGVPYLSPEMERLARHLDLAELVFYTVFPGTRLRETLATAHTVDAEAVVRASELDLFGRSRYQRLVFQLPGEPTMPTMVLLGKGSSELTGATAAMTGLAVLEGAVAPGVHFAADVLDPAWAREKLPTADAVTGLRMFDAKPVSRVPTGSEDLLEAGMEEGTV